MKIMFSIFKKNPTKKQFNSIIQNLKNILINKYPRFSGIDESTVKIYYDRWILDDNKEKIIENFEEIIEHIHIVSVDMITVQAINMYLEILNIYHEKINIIYGLS